MTPMQFLNSQNWKLTLPSGKEILFPALAAHSDKFFHMNDAGDGVIFIAPSNGGTTPNSRKSRCELREMRADGKLASWSTTSGVHSMEWEIAVHQLPVDKRHCVIGQIHGGDDDVTVVRLEDSTLWITDDDETHGYNLGPYQLGERIHLGFFVQNGVIRYAYNGNPVRYTQAKKKRNCYFKVGAYSQKDTDPALPDDDLAQVTLFSVVICHDGVCTGGSDGPPPVDPPDGDLAAAVAALQAEVAALRAWQAGQDARWAALAKAASGGK